MPLSWRLYQCNHVMGCEVVAVFADQRDCIDHERLRWSSCDPEKLRMGKLQCEIMGEKTLNGFEGVTRCTEGLLRWEDVADAGRWDF